MSERRRRWVFGLFLAVGIFMGPLSPAYATVTDTYIPIQLTADGSDTTFDFDFKVFNATDLVVAIVNPTTLVGTAQTYGVDYTVSLNTSTTGGTVTFTTAPTDTYYVSIRREVPVTQTTDIPAGGLFRETAIENALDKAILLLQQQGESIGRALLQNPYQTALDIVFPLPVSNKIIGWNAAGTGLENKVAIDDDVAAAAAASASAASGSASSASGYATAASNSAIAAAESAASIPAKASTAEAEAATADNVYMTPAKVKSEVQKSGAVLIPTGNGGTNSTAAANTANGVVILDASAKLPAVDGSQVTGITGKFVFNTTKVFDGTSPTTATDLDVSAVTGANLALCFLRLHSTGSAHTYAFCAKGDTRLQGNVAAGTSGGDCDTNEDLYIMVPTNSAGVLSWNSDVGTAVTVTFIGYWK